MLFLIMLALFSVSADLDDKDLMLDWDKHMRQFIPDFMTSFTIEAGQEEVVNQLLCRYWLRP